jgi:hypothetical protein
MKKVWFSILMGILLITVMVSFSYAQSCCSPDSGCCAVPNVSAGQNQIRVSSPVGPQMKLGTVNPVPPQLNTMPWAAAANQIGSLQRLIPAASESQPRSKSLSKRGASTVTEILASGPFFGALW